LRIVGGEKKGFVIKLPKNFESRPTTDYAKESLFNILANDFDFEDLSVLDLFAGSGSMSYEFASRGAKVTTVEILPHYCQFIRKTALDIGFKLKVVHANVFTILKKEGESFDVVFADPPYTLKGIELIPDLVFASKKLNDNGILVVEHGATTKFGGHPMLVDERNYGSVHFSFFREEKK
jgi:16S rRNA (guanine(966)-N(2))-methyltransferase RsmD